MVCIGNKILCQASETKFCCVVRHPKRNFVAFTPTKPTLWLLIMAARKTLAGGNKSEKLWRDALMRAVKRAVPGKPNKTTYLECIATRCVEAALGGEMAAIKEIGDRLDGRAIQPIAGDLDQPMRLVVEIIDPTRPANE